MDHSNYTIVNFTVEYFVPLKMTIGIQTNNNNNNNNNNKKQKKREREREALQYLKARPCNSLILRRRIDLKLHSLRQRPFVVSQTVLLLHEVPPIRRDGHPPSAASLEHALAPKPPQQCILLGAKYGSIVSLVVHQVLAQDSSSLESLDRRDRVRN